MTTAEINAFQRQEYEEKVRGYTTRYARAMRNYKATSRNWPDKKGSRYSKRGRLLTKTEV